MRNTVGSDHVPAIVNHRLLAPYFTLLAVITGCSQMPASLPDTGMPGARYVDATVLTRGDEHSDAQVLTSVTLRHISAADAEARLQANVPEGVRVSRVGEAEQLLIQGPGHAVRESIKELQRIDVR
jgi:hypothetical protein